MGKYGFNENEIRKTITNMIDKDGFHKEVVTYGKPQPPKIATGTAVSENATDSTKFDVSLITINVPEDALIYILPSTTDDEWELEIGDTLDNPIGGNYLAAGIEFEGINALMAVDEELTGEATEYYQVYAVDDELTVLDRTKVSVDFT